MKGGCPGALEPGKVGMSRKADKCSDTLLPTHGTSILLVMQTQPALSDHRLKYKVGVT